MVHCVFRQSGHSMRYPSFMNDLVLSSTSTFLRFAAMELFSNEGQQQLHFPVTCYSYKLSRPTVDT
eukprot:c33060_g1_i1 orf=356-553(+)